MSDSSQGQRTLAREDHKSRDLLTVSISGLESFLRGKSFPSLMAHNLPPFHASQETQHWDLSQADAVSK